MTGFLLKCLKACRLFYVRPQHKYSMDQYTLTINKDHKDIIVKALEKFSQMHLGQTIGEREAAKKLLLAITKSKGTIINSLTS